MDAYILTKLDQLRETQLAHGERLERIWSEVSKPPIAIHHPSILPQRWLQFSNVIAPAAAKLIGIFLIGKHIMSGGDPVKIIGMLLGVGS